MENMWNSTLFKENAKANFRRNYWSFVAVSVLLTLVSGGFMAIQINYAPDYIPWLSHYVSYTRELPWEEVMARMTFSIHVPFIFVLAFRLLVSNPYEVGACRFFLDNNGTQQVPFSQVALGFARNFGNVVLTQFLRNLFIFLWSLLFLIPGIVRSYAYFAVPYILAENPDLDHNRVLQLSMDMTRGHKMDIFFTQLSFIFWFLLDAITWNIVGVFYVQPYYNTTMAEVYRFLRFEALQRGFAAPGELPGASAGSAKQDPFL